MKGKYKQYWNDNQEKRWKWITRTTYIRRISTMKRDKEKALMTDNLWQWWRRNIKFKNHSLKDEYNELLSQWKMNLSYCRFTINRRTQSKEEAGKRFYKVRQKKWI